MMILEKLMNNKDLVVYKEIKDDSIYIKIGLAGWNEKKTDQLGTIVSVSLMNPDLDDSIAEVLLYNLVISLETYEK